MQNHIEDTALSNAYTANVLTNQVEMAVAIQDNLASVPDADNPTKTSLIPDSNSSGVIGWFITHVLPWLSPVTLALLWSDAWSKTKVLYSAEKRTKDQKLNLAMTYFRAIAQTVVMALLLTGNVYAGMILVGAVLGVGLIYGAYRLIQSMRSLYKTFKTKKIVEKESTELKSEHKVTLSKSIWTIVKNAIAFTFEFLAFMVNIYFDADVLPKLHEAQVEGDEAQALYQDGMKTGNFGEIMQAAALGKSAENELRSTSSDYDAGQKLLFGATLVAFLGMIPALFKSAKEAYAKTVAFAKAPSTGLGEIGKFFWNKLTTLSDFKVDMVQKGIPESVATLASIGAGLIESAFLLIKGALYLIPVLFAVPHALIAGMTSSEDLKKPARTDSFIAKQLKSAPSPTVANLGERPVMVAKAGVGASSLSGYLTLLSQQRKDPNAEEQSRALMIAPEQSAFSNVS